MDNLFEQQLIDISKAGAYDILVQQVGELKEENRQLIEDKKILLENLNRIMSRIEENDLGSQFPSAYQRANEAILKFNKIQ